jgi:hypothetical protein
LIRSRSRSEIAIPFKDLSEGIVRPRSVCTRAINCGTLAKGYETFLVLT